jgi:hypothetical protein
VGFVRRSGKKTPGGAGKRPFDDDNNAVPRMVGKIFFFRGVILCHYIMFFLRSRSKKKNSVQFNYSAVYSND